MADTIRRVDYFYVDVPDQAGEGARFLSALKRAGVNMLACCGFPIPGDKAQIDLVPEDVPTFLQVASQQRLKLSDRKRAFLIQGEDRVGAVADVFEKLAAQGINIVGSQALCAGGGRWGMILWVKPADYDPASRALGV